MAASTGALERRLTPAGDPILTAKLTVPALPAPTVERPRLVEQLSRSVERPVTLVCAPAGSGKTVLAGSWVAADAAPGPVAWLTVDEEDDVPGVFWTYVVAALERVGVDATGVGTPDETDRVDRSLLVRLAAQLAAASRAVVLVVDDAQKLRCTQICDDLDFLLRRTGGTFRLVLLSRGEPALPLPHYRLEGMVAEIWFPDLAFRPDEAARLLAPTHRAPSDGALVALCSGTRGWAAGLKLAGRLRADRVDDVGDLDPESDVVVYFRTVVLDRQPAPVRDLLLATSVVDVLPPGLADHLSGARGSAALLRDLAHGGLLVEPVPGRPDAYRYPPLVRSALTAVLRQEAPLRARRLQRKAARWFAAEGLTEDAVTYLGRAGDWEDCSRLLVRDRAVGQLLTGAPSDAPAVTLAAMPSTVAVPEAAVVSAAVAVVAGDLDRCDKQLARAQELVSSEPGERATGEHGPELGLAVALTAVARSAAGGGLDAVAAAGLAERMLSQLPPGRTGDEAAWALVAYGTGCGQLASGELRAARETLAAAGAAAQAARRPHLAAACQGRIALAAALDGRLTDAVDAAAAAGVPTGATTTAARAPAVAALAWVASERGDLPEADRYVRAGVAEPCLFDDVLTAAVVTLVRARLRRAAGDLRGAMDVLDRMAPSPQQVPGWLDDRLAAAAAAVSVVRGDADGAVDRVRRTRGHGAVARLALGWARLALGSAAESGRVAYQVLHQVDVPTDVLVDAHLLAAASALALGNVATSATALDEASRIAATEGLRRPFDEASRRLAAVLRQRAEHPRDPVVAGSGPATPTTTGTGQDAPLPQPLTEREQDVLRYLDALLPTEEIAARMFVSVNTVKTHVRAILRKLSAERRNDAVRRARELGLV